MPIRGKRWLIGGLGAAALLAAGLVLWLMLRPPPRPAVPRPPLAPLPDYLGVYPQPGQTLSLALRPTSIDLLPDSIAGNLPVTWQPGEVCVIILADQILPPGAHWDAADVGQLVRLTIDEQIIGGEVRVMDGLLGYEEQVVLQEADGTVISTEVVASTGGPYVFCYSGPHQTGTHTASLTIQDHVYTWWYVLEP